VPSKTIQTFSGRALAGPPLPVFCDMFSQPAPVECEEVFTRPTFESEEEGETGMSMQIKKVACGTLLAVGLAPSLFPVLRRSSPLGLLLLPASVQPITGHESPLKYYG